MKERHSPIELWFSQGDLKYIKRINQPCRETIFLANPLIDENVELALLVYVAKLQKNPYKTFIVFLKEKKVF